MYDLHASAMPTTRTQARLPQEVSPSRPEPPPRRRATPEQGMALEKLGHAIEYLMDGRLFRCELGDDDLCAVLLLMGCSRAVFAECVEVVPSGVRLRRALTRMLQPLPA